MIDPKDPNHFETRAERRARKRLARKQGRPPRKLNGRLIWLIIALVVIAVTWWYIPNRLNPTKVANSNNDLVNKSEQDHIKLVESCTTDAATKYHIHPHLAVIINGKNLDIPTNIGVDKDCLHPIHTHDQTGVVHIESPVKDEFSLVDFFRLWKKEYSANKILDQEVKSDGQLKLYADGKILETGPVTIMQDKVSYAIIYGAVNDSLKPPTNYKFPDKL